MTDYKKIRRYNQEKKYNAALNRFRKIPAESRKSDPALRTLLCLTLFLSGHVREAVQLIPEIKKKTPDASPWASDLGMVLYLAGERDLAYDMLKLAVSLPEPDGAAYNRYGAVLLDRNDLENAENAFSAALEKSPDNADIHSNMGGVLMRRGNPGGALRHYERALELNPDLNQAVRGFNASTAALGLTDETIAGLEKQLEKAGGLSEKKRIRLRLALLANTAGRTAEGAFHLAEAANASPDDIDIHIRLAAMLLDNGRYNSSLTVLKRAFAIDDKNLNVLTMAATILNEMGQHEKSLEFAEKAIFLYPCEPSALIAHAEILSASGDHSSAESALEKAAELAPGSADVWGALGFHLMQAGKTGDAADCLKKAALLNPAGLAALAEARIFQNDPKILEMMAAFAENPVNPKDTRSAMAFALARTFDSGKDSGSAFAWADRANSIISETFRFAPEKLKEQVAALKAVYSQDFFKTHSNAGNRNPGPVFIVGLPRSGTTLTEQILSSHPDVFGSGEQAFMPSIALLMEGILKTGTPYPLCMNHFRGWMAEHAASYYLKKMKAMDKGNHAFTTDKLPHNFFHLGLIATIFPAAKIIHMVRDPRDVAVSTFFTNFKYRHSVMGYAYRLTDIGHMINAWKEIMSHWKEVLPIAIHELNYEHLISSPEKEIRSVLDYLGLEWNAAVLDFNKTGKPVRTASMWQVRQPVYKTALNRWQRYDMYLRPLYKVMGQFNLFFQEH